jgi:hypothetical protein
MLRGFVLGCSLLVAMLASALEDMKLFGHSFSEYKNIMYILSIVIFM